MPLQGKFYVVTGSTSGIGRAVAESLAAQGASLIGVGRSAERSRAAEQELRPVAAPTAHVAYLVADLSVQDQVRGIAGEVRETLAGWGCSHLDGLINNAATVPFWQTLTSEGFDLQWALNHLAAFLLTSELLPLLRSAPMGRVVTVSSGSHYGAKLNWDDLQLRRGYNPLRAYSQTKLANVLFTAEFNRRFAGTSHLRAFAADPGLVNTELGLKSNSFLARWVWNLRRRGGVSPETAAKGIVYLATEPSIQSSPEVYWKHGRPKSPDSRALDPQGARHLWEVSAQMCGLPG